MSEWVGSFEGEKLRSIRLWGICTLAIGAALALGFFVAQNIIYFPLSASAATANISVTVTMSQCSDGIDNDGDGAIDYPADSDCVDLNDNDESGAVSIPPHGVGIVFDTTAKGAVIFTGRAYPNSRVRLLKDGIVATTTTTGSDAQFKFLINDLQKGTYLFVVRAEDSQELPSNLFSLPLVITPGAVTNVTNIFLSPTIAIDRGEVRPGDSVTVRGKSFPESEVMISLLSDTEKMFRVIADAEGNYMYSIDTSGLGKKNYTIRSKSRFLEEMSAESTLVKFSIGAKTQEIAPNFGISQGDINEDKHVDITDFSIMAYWYQRSAPPLKIDFNKDGKITMADFSILAFYWTG